MFTVVEQINGIAAAGLSSSPRGPVPVIYLNPTIASLLPPVQWFIYGHECMHHRLRHTLTSLNRQAELEADCGAAKLLRTQGLLSPQTLRMIVAYYEQAPILGTNQPPGLVRAGNIVACFETP